MVQGLWTSTSIFITLPIGCPLTVVCLVKNLAKEKPSGKNHGQGKKKSTHIFTPSVDNIT
jgi:hypothetical protein